ncbi:helix-turn-helix domain-containing protein [Neomoorella thermoacetica]|nr:helix-turn-helix domain-containing protein [Moorella thermoacetica]
MNGMAAKEKTLIIDSSLLKQGFTAAPNAVLYDSRISVQARWLYCILLSFAWQENECWPGQERLSKVAGWHLNTVEKYLKELREYGLISWKRQGLNRPNIYYIHEPSKALIYKDSQAGVNPESQGSVNPDSQASVILDSHLRVKEEYSDEEYVVVRAAPGQNPVSIGGWQETTSPDRGETGAPEIPLARGQEAPSANNGETGARAKIAGGKQNRPESLAIPKVDAKVKIQELFIKTAGYPLPEAALNELASYPPEYVEQKIKMLESGKEKVNTVGWLLEACREDYQQLPGPKPPRKVKPKPPRSPGNRTGPDKYRELYRLV